MFEYKLPREKIAQYPVEPADKCKLLIYNRINDKIIDEIFANLPNYLNDNYALVFNNTRVQPVKIEYNLKDGKRYDLLIYKIINGKEVHILTKLSRKTFPITIYRNSEKLGAIVGRTEFGFKLILDESATNIIEKYGAMPIPPYLKRKVEKNDYKWYQPIFAKEGFSIAAPTASLHFTPQLMEKLRNKNIQFIFLRNDVSLSTILENSRIPTHLASEYCEISEEEYKKILQMKKSGGKIIAVGTTTCKALETISRTGQLRGYSKLFIEPPFEFKLTDGIITNFHLSKSPTLSVVCAYIGTEKTKALYEHALFHNYRFLSYGDAMLIY